MWLVTCIYVSIMPPSPLMLAWSHTGSSVSYFQDLLENWLFPKVRMHACMHACMHVRGWVGCLLLFKWAKSSEVSLSQSVFQPGQFTTMSLLFNLDSAIGRTYVDRLSLCRNFANAAIFDHCEGYYSLW